MQWLQMEEQDSRLHYKLYAAEKVAETLGDVLGVEMEAVLA